MRVIDVRSGQEVKVGETVDYLGDHAWTLLSVRDWGLWAYARTRIQWHRPRPGQPEVEIWGTPLVVRLRHPRYTLQRVGFFIPLTGGLRLGLLARQRHRDLNVVHDQIARG